MSIIAINAMILESGRLSGIGHYIVELVSYFARFNGEAGSPDQILIFCRDEARHHLAHIDGIVLRPVRARRGRAARVAIEQLYLPWLLRKAGAEVVLNPSFTGPVWGARAVVTTVHDLYFRVIPDLIPRAQRLFLSALVPFCARRSRTIIAPSNATKLDLARFYPDLDGKIAVIPLASRFSSVSPTPPRKDQAGQPPFVLLVAALTGNKNPEPLVAAVADLRKRHPALGLVHVGSDPEGRLEAASARHQAADWISSRSGISDAELGELYSNCLCVAMPSLYEGFGLPLLEAQAHGAPIVSSDRASLPEVGGEGALYVNPTDPARIADAIEKLIAAPEVREALIRAGFANQARFSWEKTARMTWAMLRASEKCTEAGTMAG